MSHPHPPRPRRAHLRASVFPPAGPIGAAVRAALFISLAASPLILAAPPAHAQSQPVARYGVNIPAGPLGQALIAFANAVGVELSMDTGQLSGKNSQGLQGQYTVQAGFAALLSGHGFQAVRTANGSYALARIPDPAQGVLLPVVTVQGDPDADPALTEGTGSYTTRAMSTATGLALSPRETPQSVSIVTRQQIDDRNIKSLAEALRTTTGMAESAYDTERSSFSYRGFSVENYLYDGVPTTFSSPYAAGESDLDSVIYDRIEIVRGATGLMTGAGNPSAAINLVRKRALRDKVEGEITASAGSWDNYRTTIDIATPFNKEATVRGRFVAAGQMGNSFLDNHEKKKGVLFGTVEADLTDRTLLRAGADYQVNRPKASTWGGALGTGWFSNGEAIDWPRSFNGAPKWSQWNSTTQSQFISLDHRFQNGWKGQVGYARSKQEYDAKLGMSKGGQIDKDTWTSPPGTIYSNWFEGYRSQDSVNAKLDGDFDLFGRKHEFMVGSSGTWQRNKGTVRLPVEQEKYSGSILEWNGNYPEPQWGERESELSSRTRQIGLYAAGRFSLADPLKVIVGARYTSWNNSLTRTFDVVSPYAGIVLDVSRDVSLYASYTDIFQPQDYQDSSGAYLDPVRGKNYEAGIKSAFFDNRLNASLSVFHTKQDNVAEADLDNLVPGSAAQAYRAVNGTQSNGFEVELSGQVLPGWNIQAGYAHFNLVGPDGAKLNTALPRNTFNLFTTYAFSGALRNLTVGGGVRWQSGSWATVWGADGSGPFVQRRADLPSYAIANLMARYAFTPQTALQLNINNLFDKKYYSQVNFYSTRNYGDPRNFMVTLSHKF